MGVRLQPVNYDEVFHKLTRAPKIVNDIVESSEKDKAMVNKLIYTTYTSYTGDILSNVPSCVCEHLKDSRDLGAICPICGTEVMFHIDRAIESIAWIRAPQGVKAIISPLAWQMLTDRFTKRSFDFIRWLCDTDFVPKGKIPPEVQEITNLGIERGYNNFVENFDTIIATLMEMPLFRVKSGERDELKEYLGMYRDRIFTQYLPIPNRLLFVVEEAGMDRYSEPVNPVAVNAIRLMIGIDVGFRPLTVRQKENRTVKSIVLWAQFYAEYAKENLSPKEGSYRKHVFGGRDIFSGRAVIVSNTRPHIEHSLKIPWCIGTTIFRYHLANKLLKNHGMSVNEAIGHIESHARRYSPLLDQIFQELLDEVKQHFIGHPCLIVRNPSLGRGSVLFFAVTEVEGMYNRPEEAENTVFTLPILNTKPLGADFDGDEISMMLMLDKFLADAVDVFAPYMNLMSMERPREASSNPSLPKPAVSMIANTFSRPVETDPAKVAQMRALLGARE